MQVDFSQPGSERPHDGAKISFEYGGKTLRGKYLRPDPAVGGGSFVTTDDGRNLVARDCTIQIVDEH